MKKDIEKERFDKLEKCVRDKDKRISVLEQRFIDIKKSVFGVLLLVFIGGIILFVYFASEWDTNIYNEFLKLIGVISITMFASTILLKTMECIDNFGKVESEKDISSIDTIMWVALIPTIIIFALYIFITFPPPGS